MIDAKALMSALAGQNPLESARKLIEADQDINMKTNLGPDQVTALAYQMYMDNWLIRGLDPLTALNTTIETFKQLMPSVNGVRAQQITDSLKGLHIEMKNQQNSEKDK